MITVKPVHKGLPRDLKKWPFDKGALINERFILAITKLYWPLLTGGHCSEVAVSSGLTVYEILDLKFFLNDVSSVP